MLYKNAFIFDSEKGFFHGSFETENGKFTKILDSIPSDPGIDLENAYVIPGLIEMHSHGNSGADFSDGDYDGLRKMAAYYAENGVSSFAPATLTLPYDVLEKAFKTAVRLSEEKPEGCSKIMGIQMEGPFFSEKKKGAQNAAYLRLPDFDAFEKLFNASNGLLRIVDIAPELEGAVSFTEKASKLCTVSVAHTDASYEDACAVFDAGARHLTHLFNAMPPIHHRKPGPIGAASEREGVCAEIICDGFHVHESSIRMAFKLFPERICLVSDSGRCAGLPDGTEFELGGQMATLIDGVARLKDGTIACSAANLYSCMLNAIRFGISIREAINAATINPARQLGRADEIGSIEVGKCADFVVCNEKLERKSVYINGIKLSFS